MQNFDGIMAGNQYPCLQMKSKIILVLLLLIVQVVAAESQNPIRVIHTDIKNAEIAINSIRIDGVAKDKVGIELDITNSGELGELHSSAIANSFDGVFRSYSHSGSIIVPKGKNIKLQTRVLRPAITEKSRTDEIQVWLFPLNNPLAQAVLRVKVELPINWEDVQNQKPENGMPKGSVLEKSVERETLHYFAFGENINEENHQAVDALLTKLNQTREVGESGEWLIRQYQAVIRLAFGNTNNAPLRNLVERWRLESPQSVGAAIAEANYLRSMAWRIRGGPSNKQVSPLAMRLFKEKMQQAQQVMTDSKSYGMNNPLWHQNYLLIASENSTDELLLTKAFQEAIELFPGYRGLYTQRAIHFALKSGMENWEKVDEVVSLAVMNTEKSEGRSSYAAIYSAIDESVALEFDLFKDSLATWPKMKQGLQDLTRLHPSRWTTNKYAQYACAANDSTEFTKAWDRMGDRLTPQFWRNNYSADICTKRFFKAA